MGNQEKITLEEMNEHSREMINSEEYLKKSRKQDTDFTRKRKMPFTKLIAFMLNMIKSSIQTCLDKFFENLSDFETHMTQQSFSEARQKIKWEAFQDLFKMTVQKIYSHGYEKWHGYRVSAIDGSKAQLPDEEKLREHFGTLGKNEQAATGQASALYDVYNNVIMDAQLEPMATDERTLAMQHIEELCKMESFDKECVIYDRGYASFEMVETMIERNIHFVMRVKKGFNKEIDALSRGDHYVVLRKRGHQDIRVRVLKFVLPSGEIEMLITDIFDKRMGVKAFKKLYFKRWPIETKYDEIKNKLEVENFSGLTVEAVKQDFFITMYMSNIAAVASWEAQETIDEIHESKDNKYDYHVNTNHAIGTLKDRFILALLEDNPLLRSKKIDRILNLMTKHYVPTRPDRSLPRKKSVRSAKFRHNRKSNC